MQIDLNSDLGESLGAWTMGDDAAMLDIVTSANVACTDLVASVIYQIGALQGLAAAAGTWVRYVKPHGALYNSIAHDERQARDVIAALKAVDADRKSTRLNSSHHSISYA